MKNHLLSKGYLIEFFIYTLGYTALKWLKEIVTLGINYVLHHNLIWYVLWMHLKYVGQSLLYIYHELLEQILFLLGLNAAAFIVLV